MTVVLTLLLIDHIASEHCSGQVARLAVNPYRAIPDSEETRSFVIVCKSRWTVNCEHHFVAGRIHMIEHGQLEVFSEGPGADCPTLMFMITI